MRQIYTLLLIMVMALLPSVMRAAYTPTQVIEKASQEINSAKSLTAKFSGSTTGTLSVAGDKFAMVAGGFGIWYNGTDMWTYSKSAGETSLTTPTKSELLESNPIEIIKSYTNTFDVAKVSEKGNLYTLKLTPKDKKNNVKGATLVIDTATWLPVSIDMVMNNDTRLVVNIDKITKGNTPTPSTFDYPEAKYPGIEVVDLR